MLDPPEREVYKTPKELEAEKKPVMLNAIQDRNARIGSGVHYGVEQVGANTTIDSSMYRRRASYFQRLIPDVTAALEGSDWDFQTGTFTASGLLGPRATPGCGDPIDGALAYQF